MKKANAMKTISLRLSVDVRQARGDYVSPSGERRETLSGSDREIDSRLEEYAKAGLEYLVAYIYHEEVKEIITDVKKFSAEIIRSFS